jgi:hypothetical protein
VPELDLQQFFLTDAPARIRAFIDEATLPIITTADTLHEAMEASENVPAVFGIHARMPNKPVNGRRKLIVGRRTKLYRFLPVFAVVTESYGPKEDGRVGGWSLCQQLANILDGWRAPGMKSTFDVIDIAFVIRGVDVTRVQHQIVLEGDAELFTTPPL